MNFKMFKDTIKKNGPGIATAASIILTGLSVIFAIKKAKDGSKLIDEYQEKKQDLDNLPIDCVKRGDKAILMAEYAVKFADVYKESLICAGGAMVGAYLSNKWNGRTIAGLSAALMLNEDKIKRIYKKADEIYGKNGGPDLKEAVDCDIPPFDAEPEKAKVRHRREEPCLFYESASETLFESNPRDVEEGLARAKRLIEKDPRHILDYNKLRSLIGLRDIPLGVCKGWNRTKAPFVPSTKIVYIDGQEVIGIFYENDPISDYYSTNIY